MGVQLDVDDLSDSSHHTRHSVGEAASTRRLHDAWFPSEQQNAMQREKLERDHRPEREYGGGLPDKARLEASRQDDRVPSSFEFRVRQMPCICEPRHVGAWQVAL